MEAFDFPTDGVVAGESRWYGACRMMWRMRFVIQTSFSSGFDDGSGGIRVKARQSLQRVSQLGLLSLK